jgi:hypothetical protein
MDYRKVRDTVADKMRGLEKSVEEAFGVDENDFGVRAECKDAGYKVW